MTKKTTTDRLGRPHGGGMPKAKIDLEKLEALCYAQCTLAEIAAYFGLAEKTIARRGKVAAFAEAMERGRAKGRVSLRRKQMELANAGNPTMLIWLGKQLLGQRDHHELTGKDGGAIEVKEIRVSFVAPSE